MIYDADTWIGNWPFRRLPHTTATDLLRQMDANGIDKALVGAVEGILYMDAQQANSDLAKQIRRHRDRLIPCAVLDPTYIGWADDLKQCRQEWGMPVLRLVPQYHPYHLTDEPAEEIVATAHELKMRVAVYGRIIDRRGRSRLDTSRDLPTDEILALFRKFPKASFMLLNSSAVKPPKGAKAPKIYQDVAIMHGGFGLGIEKALKICTPDRLMFGSSALLHYMRPAMLSMEKLEAAKAVKEKIFHKNLKRLLPEIA